MRAHLSLPTLCLAALACIAKPPETVPSQVQSSPTRAAACDDDDGGLVLPEGFCAGIVGDGLGPVREIAVAPNGDLYAAVSARGADDGNTGSGGVLAFRDTTGDGRPDVRATFGPSGGNDVAVRDGRLYFALNDRIVRWRLTPGRLEPEGEPEVVVADLPADGGHVAKSLAFEGGQMYVNVGSRTNSCQERDRVSGSKGLEPCTELERRGGIWTFAADRAGQSFADGTRFATGLRNAMALAVQPGTGRLFAAVHGRDQLSDNWGFSPQVNADNPTEELVVVERGDDFGWPYCYHSADAKRLVLAPEYGGDGSAVGRCAGMKAPLVALPGHWAPMAMAFYQSDAFGPDYRGGVFLAFHGSWNRAPLPQAGFRVVFLPFRNGRPTGEYETFAALRDDATGLRASGVAVAPDGALYISADDNETIWRVVKR